MPIRDFSPQIGSSSHSYRVTAKMRIGLRAAIAPLAVLALGAASPPVAINQEQVKVVFDHAVPNAAGKKMVAVTVHYPPAAKSMPHHHAASAFIYAYVLSGAVRSQVGDGPARIYRAGEGFYEMPGAHHVISENASDKDPASLLAVFVVDSKEDALTTPDQMPSRPR